MTPARWRTCSRPPRRRGGRSGPEWLSSHPNPGNRSDAIVKEASMLRVEGNGDSGQFQSIKSRL
ncbi:MAG TPA: hypothetical protein VFO21_14860, partial [Vicinamibacterales bacterium]|nr:hypothetical protein [Vicinamibacterales bacterium]